jgi:hypothetical protein
LPIDLGRFDFERERDLDDLMSSVFPAWVWVLPEALHPAAEFSRVGSIDGCQGCEMGFFR